MYILPYESAEELLFDYTHASSNKLNRLFVNKNITILLTPWGMASYHKRFHRIYNYIEI